MIPFATVVIPARNEEHDIVGCLDAVAEQDVSPGSLEVIVADGRSEDRTRELVAAYRLRGAIGRLACVDNPARGIAAGLNVAVAAASGSVIVRVDARSRIAPEYISTVTQVLERQPSVGVTGGAQVALDRGTGVIAAGIARALRNRYTTGLSRYRRSDSSGPADTVWMGAFRVTELRSQGGWDERLEVNEDFELCERYRRAGLQVWVEGSLRSGYLPRSSIGALGQQYFAFGRTKGARWIGGASLSSRHALLLLSVPAAAFAVTEVRARCGGAVLAAGLVVTAVLVDHLGVRERASAPVRGASIVASGVSIGAWYGGVVVGASSKIVGLVRQGVLRAAVQSA